MFEKMEIVHKEEGLKRNNYFTGMLLTIEDYSVEQDYFLNKLRQHNRFLHGWGVVSGLEVFIRDQQVFVEPGIAVDCAGNEILINEKVVASLPNDKRVVYVVADYNEYKVNPVPEILNNGSTLEQKEYSRIQEVCQVKFSSNDPSVEHDNKGPGTPGCGVIHALTIASLHRKQRGWSVKLHGRR